MGSTKAHHHHHHQFYVCFSTLAWVRRLAELAEGGTRKRRSLNELAAGGTRKRHTSRKISIANQKGVRMCVYFDFRKITAAFFGRTTNNQVGKFFLLSLGNFSCSVLEIFLAQCWKFFLLSV